MTITRLVAAMACAIAVGSCGGSSFGPSLGYAPKWENLDAKPTTVPLKLESNPPGAEARAPQGLTCRTPCTLDLPIMAEGFNISYALNGYAPQSVSIRPVMPTTTTGRGVPFYLPDPAVAQLSPAAAAPKPPPKKRAVATAAKPASPAQAAPTAQTAPAAQASPPIDAPQPYPYPPPPSVFGLKRY
jgi:hypothetical protein